ncbi:MAG TPA: acyl-CoA dehydrogenase family protein [Thermoleophilaceae bacterium]|jgi:alkylation response protein AidB-like acyl-CoA dehydrogenase
MIEGAATAGADATGAGAAFMARERAALESALPGLNARALELPLLEREKEDSGLIAAFRDVGGPGLLVPATHSGIGLTAVDAVRVHRALGALSPSLAVAVTMHNFSIATLVEVSRGSDGMEWFLLEAVASDNRLVASGFAEGRPGQGILAPVMTATRNGSKVTMSGSKKPCSLSASMDMLTASFRMVDGDEEKLAVAMIPASSPGLERKPFWSTWVLAGAESHEVILNDVEIDEQLVIVTDTEVGDGGMSDLDARGLLWFELLITASYVGVASALVERALESGKGSPAERVAPAMELEACVAALEGVARGLDADEPAADLLRRGMLVRYASHEAVSRSVRGAAETLGGMAFIGSSEVAYLIAAAHALALHPPSRTRMWAPLADALQGAPLKVD